MVGKGRREADAHEITGEMVEAGVRALYVFDPDDRADLVVRTIFREMILAAPRPQR